MRIMSTAISAFALVALVCVTIFLTSQYILSKEHPRLTSSRVTELSIEEITPENIQIAFGIQAYSETIHLLPSLLKVLWHPRNIYTIHIDAKVANKEYNKVVRKIQNHFNDSNIIFIQREYVTYFGITTVLSTVDAISFLLKHSSKWQYFINLSASDYPLVTPTLLREMLARPEVIENEFNFIQLVGPPDRAIHHFYDLRLRHINMDTGLWANITRPVTSEDAQMQPVSSKEKDCANGCVKRISGELPHPLMNKSAYGRVPLVKSEAWFIMHRKFAEYSANSPPARRLATVLSAILCPEELYFGTLLYLDGRFEPTIVTDAFRFIMWGTENVGRNGSHPVLLDMHPLTEIKEKLVTSGAFFARKRSKAGSNFTRFVDNSLAGVNGPNERSVVYSATARQRMDCMMKLRSSFSSYYSQFTDCMKLSAKFKS